MGEQFEIKAGDVFRVPYPFMLETYKHHFDTGDKDADGWPIWKAEERPSWRPGAEWQPHDYPGEGEMYAHAVGCMVLTVVSTHKPGHFPERVFYTRKWVDPDGKEFGKGGCRVATISKFRALIRGYGYEYVIEPPAEREAA